MQAQHIKTEGRRPGRMPFYDQLNSLCWLLLTVLQPYRTTAERLFLFYGRIPKTTNCSNKRTPNSFTNLQTGNGRKGRLSGRLIGLAGRGARTAGRAAGCVYQVNSQSNLGRTTGMLYLCGQDATKTFTANLLHSQGQSCREHSLISIQTRFSDWTCRTVQISPLSLCSLQYMSLQTICLRESSLIVDWLAPSLPIGRFPETVDSV